MKSLKLLMLWAGKNMYWLKWLILAGIGFLGLGKISRMLRGGVPEEDKKDRDAYVDAISSSNNEVAEKNEKVKKDLDKVEELNKKIKSIKEGVDKASGTDIQNDLNGSGL